MRDVDDARPDLKTKYVIAWNRDKRGYEVIRKADGEVAADNFTTCQSALEWITGNSGILLELPVDDDCWYCWRRLDDDDIKTVFQSLPGSLREFTCPSELRVGINDLINFWEAVPTGLIMRARYADLPHVKLKEIRKLSGALLRVLECLRDDSSLRRDNLVRGLTWARAQLSDEDLSSHQIATPPVSIEAAIDAVRLLKLAAAANDDLEVLRQEKLDTKAPKRRNYRRYFLIQDLAVLFEAAFKTPASQYADGPWCSFLAAVLSCCEGQAMKNNGALGLWKEIHNIELREGRLGDVSCRDEKRRRLAYDVHLPPGWAARVAQDEAPGRGGRASRNRRRPKRSG